MFVCLIVSFFSTWRTKRSFVRPFVSWFRSRIEYQTTFNDLSLILFVHKVSGVVRVKRTRVCVGAVRVRVRVRVHYPDRPTDRGNSVGNMNGRLNDCTVKYRLREGPVFLGVGRLVNAFKSTFLFNERNLWNLFYKRTTSISVIFQDYFQDKSGFEVLKVGRLNNPTFTFAFFPLFHVRRSKKRNLDFFASSLFKPWQQTNS